MSNIIVMSFSPRNIAGCFVKKRLTKGGDHGHPRTPLATPLDNARAANDTMRVQINNIPSKSHVIPLLIKYNRAN